MQITEKEFKIQAIQFLEKVFSYIDTNAIKIEKYWNIDHLCFRVSTEESYQFYKNQLSSFSELLIESEVNGRLISTFKFSEPIFFRDWSIGLVELPAPKKGKFTAQGFEHIEIAIDQPLEEIKKMYPSCTFDLGGMSKEFNQELEIIFKDAAIKFHPLSLESVINIEKNQRLFAALKESKILTNLKDCSPYLSGTFPLGLAVENSDLDILIYHSDLKALSDVLKSLFSLRDGYKIIQNDHNVVCEFKVNGFKFEIYAEEKHPSMQTSNLHFLIEERLLKLGSTDFKNRIIELKKLGNKTEKAFADYLKLEGDPFQGLLDIRKKSEKELIFILS